MAANTARRDLKAYVSELAIELAEKKIRVSKDTDEALVRAVYRAAGKGRQLNGSCPGPLRPRLTLTWW